MRRLGAPSLLLMLLAIIFTVLLSACGGSTAPSTSTGTGKPAAQTVTLVTDTGGLNDQSFNESAYNGYLKAMAQYGFKKQVIETQSDNDYVKNLTLAAQQSDLVIGVGFLMATAMDQVARTYPNKKFALIDSCPSKGTDGSCDTLPNVASLYFREEQAGCLVGAAAGEFEKLGKSKMSNLLGSNTIGAIGGVEIPPVDHYIAGYQFCAKKVDPSITVKITYSQTFDDTSKCLDAANNQINQFKADIIFQVAGNCGNGALQAAKSKNVYSIGVDSDQHQVNDSVITSAIKKVDQATFETIDNFEAGKFTNNPPTFDLKSNGVGFVPFSKTVPADVATTVTAVVDQYSKDIVSGALVVPQTVQK